MNRSTWLMAILLAAFFGGLVGWSARVTTADHRYIRAQAERQEAEARYYTNQLDELIQENKGNIQKERSNAKH
jgi:hypothetical protein